MNIKSIQNLGYRKMKDGSIRRGLNINHILAYKAVEECAKLKEENTPKMKYGLSRVIVNLEKLYVSDMERNIGFNLDLSIDYNPNELSNEVQMRNGDSIFSNKFGGSYSSKDTITHVCECGATESDVSGVKCDVCNTFTDINVCKRGWIVLDKFKVFNPDYLSLLKTYINTRKPGVTRKLVEHMLEDTKGESKFSYIALQDINKVIEFIDLFIVDEMKEYFLNNIDKALTSKIPVISSNYRYYRVEPSLNKSTPNIKTHDYNKSYISMSNTARNLNNLSHLSSYATKSNLIKHLNETYMKLYLSILADLGKDKKKGLMRGKVSGKYKPASAKIIIEACKNVEIDECILPYKIFGLICLRDFQRDLNAIGLTADGFKRLSRGTPSVADKIVLNMLLKQIQERNHNIVTVLRAPSIYLTSIVALKIKALHDHTVVGLHDLVIGPLLAGDKDGDTAIVVLPSPRVMISLFAAYHPSKAVFNTVTGEINPDYELPESNYYLMYDIMNAGSGRELVNGKAPTLVDPKKLNLVRNHNIAI